MNGLHADTVAHGSSAFFMFGKNPDHCIVVSGFDKVLGILDVALSHVDVFHCLFHYGKLFWRQIQITKNLIEIK